MHPVINRLRSLPRPALVYAFVLAGLSSSCNSGGPSSTSSSTDSTDSTSKNQDESGFEQIFNGENLDGWEGDTTLWRVEDGTLVGEITPGKELEQNSFIIWREGVTADFELKTEYRISAESGNSGINYRSEEVAGVPYALKGYQADIDAANQYTGQNYEERGRTIMAFRGQQVTIPETEGDLRSNVKNNTWASSEVTASLGDTDSLKAHIREGWNEIHIIAKGNHLQHYINGVLMSEVIDDDTANRKLKGLLGMQVHVGPPMQIAYRNIRLKSL